MKRRWLELYALAVCFFNMIIFVVFGGILLWNLMQVGFPGFTLHSETWTYYQSDEGFREQMVNRYCCTNVNCSYQPPVGQELTDARLAAFDQALVGESRTGFQDLIRNFIILLINTVLFVVHWRLAKRERPPHLPDDKG